jgi:hypothetical protein
VGANALDFTVFSSQSAPEAHSTLYLDDMAINRHSLGVNDINKDLASIYPNPAKDMLHITLKRQTEAAHINIINAAGAVVASFDSKNTANISVPVQQLIPGIYFCEVRQGMAIVRSAFVKQ